MESKRGGKREGAGRKSKSEEMELVGMLNKHIDKDEAIKKLKVMIDEGELQSNSIVYELYVW